MYMMNATSTPISKAPPPTMRAPKYSARPIATAVRISTTGSRPDPSLPVRKFALR